VPGPPPNSSQLLRYPLSGLGLDMPPWQMWLEMDTNCGPYRDGEAIELALFDIDGPITDPESRRVEQPEILDLTLSFLGKNNFAAYNTGRASAIAYRRVISPQVARAISLGVDPGFVSSHIAVFAEKGAVSSIWDGERNQWNHNVDPATVVSPGLRDEVLNLLRNDLEFQAHIFYDHDKETMVSVEMRHETPEPTPVPVTVDVFKPIAERFAAEVRQLADERGYDDLEVDCTTIAVDIQRRGVGKDLGTRLAFEWIGSLGKRVARVHCFGDSRSDLAMATEAHSMMSRWFADADERVVYINVGERLVIDGSFRVRNFPNMYGLGTVAYLREISRSRSETRLSRAGTPGKLTSQTHE
jgi:hydroxymethylpyrimidine pyrophosphatase-like HAD family hydrolase